MHIAGGLYRELCVTPHWNALFGSGGRAALSLAQISPRPVLHCYASEPDHLDCDIYHSSNVEMVFQPRQTPIVFAYFHPLSRPHVAPDKIQPCPALHVQADTVLRFGYLEGDAIVSANRAIYDPQTWNRAPSFYSNGSTADRLAVVLNELELRSISGRYELAEAADWIFETQGAAVVVVKRGIRGATVYEREGRVSDIPVYRSRSVFKIGTGDIFSAVFAYHWGELKLEPSAAADLASQAVAAYCSTRALPLDPNIPDGLERVSRKASGPVALLGSVDTIGRCYTMEEVRYGLLELGLKLASADSDNELDRANTLLILGDGLPSSAIDLARKFSAEGKPIVVLCEAGAAQIDPALAELGIRVAQDIVTALYFAGWAAAE